MLRVEGFFPDAGFFDQEQVGIMMPEAWFQSHDRAFFL